MESKEHLIKYLQNYVINFNEYWEDPITESALVKNTLDTVETIKSYCKVIGTYYKKNKNLKGDYNNYSPLIQQTISEVISLVSDGRDLWHSVKYEHIAPDPIGFSSGEPRTYDHHVQKNGHLDYENDPFYRNDDIVEICDKLIMIISSEQKMSKGADFSEITDGDYYYEFEGYESGSMDVKFDKIYLKGNNILIDGKIVYYTTYDSHTVDYPGIVVMEVEDYDISHLPYIDSEDFFDEDSDFDGKELLDCIKKHKKFTLAQVVKKAKSAIESYIVD